jgi:transposase
VRTPLAKRQEILAAFDGSGMSAARFAAMVGINYSTFCSWVQERNQKQGKDSVLSHRTTYDSRIIGNRAKSWTAKSF